MIWAVPRMSSDCAQSDDTANLNVEVETLREEIALLEDKIKALKGQRKATSDQEHLLELTTVLYNYVRRLLAGGPGASRGGRASGRAGADSESSSDSDSDDSSSDSEDDSDLSEPEPWRPPKPAPGPKPGPKEPRAVSPYVVFVKEQVGRVSVLYSARPGACKHLLCSPHRIQRRIVPLCSV
jgi:hypothetical protein